MAKNELNDITYIESIIFNVLDEVSGGSACEKSHNFSYITLGLIDDFFKQRASFLKKGILDILEQISRLKRL